MIDAWCSHFTHLVTKPAPARRVSGGKLTQVPPRCENSAALRFEWYAYADSVVTRTPTELYTYSLTEPIGAHTGAIWPLAT
eukprot:1611553-Lingulodinium_polyedra.AAC.1